MRLEYSLTKQIAELTLTGSLADLIVVRVKRFTGKEAFHRNKLIKRPSTETNSLSE